MSANGDGNAEMTSLVYAAIVIYGGMVASVDRWAALLAGRHQGDPESICRAFSAHAIASAEALVDTLESQP